MFLISPAFSKNRLMKTFFLKMLKIICALTYDTVKDQLVHSLTEKIIVHVSSDRYYHVSQFPYERHMVVA